MTDNNTNTDKPACPLCRTSHEPGSACIQTTTELQSTGGGPLLAQAESLFESYLAARLVRARRNLTEAKVALLRDPRNRDKRDALLKAEAEAQKLESQLLEQARRAAKARERANDGAKLAAVSAAAPVNSPQPTEDFRTLQAAKADITLASSNGSAVRSKETIAEAFLSEEELTALRTAKFSE